MSFPYTDRSHLSAYLSFNMVDASFDLIEHSKQGQAKAFENLKHCIMCYEDLCE